MQRWIFAALSVVLLAGCGEGPGPVLSDFDNRVVFVNYWAEWCKPCREEIPELNRFQDQYPDAVKVVGVNYDGANGEELRRQEEALGIEFPTLAADPRVARGLPAPPGLPETLVFDADGQLRKTLIGPQTLANLNEVLQMVRTTEESGE